MHYKIGRGEVHFGAQGGATVRALGNSYNRAGEPHFEGDGLALEVRILCKSAPKSVSNDLTRPGSEEKGGTMVEQF